MSEESTQHKRKPRSRIAFHLLLICLLILGGTTWAIQVNSRPAIPTLHRTPRTIGPLHDYPMVVSEDQLEVVLTKIRPLFSRKPAKTNFVDHALRLWGVQVDFEGDAIDGAELREMLINDNVFEENWGESELPLLTNTGTGIKVRTQEGRSTVSHVDHLMGSLAEVGTPLDHPVIVAGNRNASVADLLTNALRTFKLNQKEYEWTALALAFYATGNESWFTNEGQEINFDRLCDRIMRQQQPQGVCYGQHRLYTLTILLRIDEQMQSESPSKKLLASETREKVVGYLKSMTKRLYQSQSIEGYWDGNWPDAAIAVRDPGTDATSRRILATGHTLEWWAMAPRELHPPRETIIRAGQWLAREIGSLDIEKVQKNYTFLTHAARALALWRGKFADEHYQIFQERALAKASQKVPARKASSRKVLKASDQNASKHPSKKQQTQTVYRGPLTDRS